MLTAMHQEVEAKTHKNLLKLPRRTESCMLKGKKNSNVAGARPAEELIDAVGPRLHTENMKTPIPRAALRQAVMTLREHPSVLGEQAFAKVQKTKTQSGKVKDICCRFQTIEY